MSLHNSRGANPGWAKNIGEAKNNYYRGGVMDGGRTPGNSNYGGGVEGVMGLDPSVTIYSTKHGWSNPVWGDNGGGNWSVIGGAGHNGHDNKDLEHTFEAVGLAADVNSAVWTGAKILMKGSGTIMKAFTGPATAVGAIIGAGTAIYDMRHNPNPNYSKDGAQVVLGIVAGFSEFIGVGEVWDWVGIGAAAISTGIDIYDATEHH